MNRREFLIRAGGGTSLFALGSCSDLASTESRPPRPPADYPVRPVAFTDVHLKEGFWGPRMATNREVTLPICFKRCDETSRLLHFDLASGAASGPFQGKRYDDSDVFKVIEGAAYALSIAPDKALDSSLDQLIQRIAAAQESDGYLYTTRTANPESPTDTSPGRWSDLAHGHELYNVGHLYEAAVAHFAATGKRTLLNVAIRNADLIDSVFGPAKMAGAPGHQEIEIGLVKLFRTTGERRYLNLAKFFIDQRGRGSQRELFGDYSQDHLPVVEQREAVGHSVRAGYLYSGIADVAAMTDDQDYLASINSIWKDVVSSKLYITGGVGSERNGEKFGAPYHLPNAEAYAETCAAIANMMWNHRLFLLHGEAEYVDVLERTLYNGFLAGVSFSGDLFFYPNPLASDGETAFNQGTATRAPWFSTACCPTNVCRFLPSLPGYQYAMREDSLFVSLFLAGETSIRIAGVDVRIHMETDYPWEGEVHIGVTPERPVAFSMQLRIPGWSLERPVPSDLYHYVHHYAIRPEIRINNDEPVEVAEPGFYTVTRRWNAGDRIYIHLPMPVRRVLSHPKVEANTNRVVMERGPLVYCLEGVDHGGTLDGIALADDTKLDPMQRADLLGGITTIEGTTATGNQLIAVPYHVWSHRGPGEMAVWLPRHG